MPLADSTRLGTYEVLTPIGAGGMGEVYRARDTRLRQMEGHGGRRNQSRLVARRTPAHVPGGRVNQGVNDIARPGPCRRRA